MSQRIVTCPSCGAKYRIPETFKGTKAACKKCGTVIEIPPPGEEQAQAPAAAPAGEEAPKAPAAEEKAEKKERPRRGRARAAGRTRTGTRGSRRARAAAAEEGGEETAGEEEKEKPSRGRRSARAGRTRAGGRGGSRRGGRGRSRGDEEEGGGNNAMVIGLVAVLVVVVAVVAYFLLSGGEEKKPAPAETAKAKPEKPKVNDAEKARQKALAEEKARQAKEAAAKPKESTPKPAPKKTDKKPAKKPAAAQETPKKKKRIPPPEVDLEHLEPLDFPAGTPDSLKEKIKSLAQDAFDVWGGARQNRAIAKLIEIGYPAVPIVINKIIKLDYMKKDDVELGQVLFRLLTDMCNGQGLEFKGEFDEVEKKDPWDCEYDIRWNRAAAYKWYQYWQKFGDTRENWEKHIAFKKKRK